jgi:hypothetical protein
MLEELCLRNTHTFTHTTKFLAKYKQKYLSFHCTIQVCVTFRYTSTGTDCFF